MFIQKEIKKNNWCLFRKKEKKTIDVYSERN